MKERKKIILTAVITFLATALVFSFVFSRVFTRADLIRFIIAKQYAGDVDETKVRDYSAKGAVAALGDEHSYYLTAEEYNAISSQITGAYKGIGVEVFLNQSGQIEISTVFGGTPAFNAGLKSGDILLGVDALTATAENYADVISYLRGLSEEGKAAENMTMKILRGEQQLDIAISRADVEIQTVYSEDKDNQLYIRITNFTESTVKEFLSALSASQNKTYDGLIIDVRDNPGGYLESVTKICDILLPEATIVYTSDKHGKTQYFKSDSKAVSLPTVVLVNSESASASEILAGALHDNGVATLVGEKTYGKGSVQQIFGFPDKSALKLTIAHYYTPAGVCIDGIGIEPDFAVALADENKALPTARLTPAQDTQLQKAIELLKK